MDAVAETLRCSWDEVWRMRVTEFLNLLSYRKDKIAKMKEDQKKWQRTH